MFSAEKISEKIKNLSLIKIKGVVKQVIGLVVEAKGPRGAIGDMCYIISKKDKQQMFLEIVGFKEGRTLLMPLGEMQGIVSGDEVIALEKPFVVKVGENLRGRILNGLGQPIDNKGEIISEDEYPVYAVPPHPLKRKRITNPLVLGVRSIDTLLTCGMGQRLGIFSGSGVGKSMLLGMIARNTSADINVIALVGERGREVREFIERDLGEEGLQRSIVIVATSNQPSLVRINAAFVATAIAEYFRDKGENVLFMMDSVTRLAFAQRDIGLAIGEPPATKGYPPSVYTLLPRLLERTGTSQQGSITGLYTVLVEGDDLSDPIADQVRSILDGHIVLSRDLANRGHYPAIDILASISRVMVDIVSKEQLQLATMLKETLAVYRDAEDLINIGAYVDGSNKKIDFAKSKIEEINNFLKQDFNDNVHFQESLNKLAEIFKY